MIIYAKIRENGEYHSPNIYYATAGFREMGAEIRKYRVIDEIYDEVTREDIVVDYIAQTHVVEAFRTILNRPMGCSVDFAVIEKHGKEQTVFLEMNNGNALGNYGLQHILYAKLISARWSQLLERKDEFDFRQDRTD